MIEIPKYEVVIYWSKEDNCYLAEVPELSGCIADGKTLKEVVDNVELIIREWIECAVADGDDIPEPKGKLMYA
jgi:predicted RNase H-like HicB family nuclease